MGPIKRKAVRLPHSSEFFTICPLRRYNGLTNGEDVSPCLRLSTPRASPRPTPVILAKQAMAAGEHSFTVLVDNATAVETSSAWRATRGSGAAVTQGRGVFRGLHPYRLRRL